MKKINLKTLYDLFDIIIIEYKRLLFEMIIAMRELINLLYVKIIIMDTVTICCSHLIMILADSDDKMMLVNDRYYSYIKYFSSSLSLTSTANHLIIIRYHHYENSNW